MLPDCAAIADNGAGPVQEQQRDQQDRHAARPVEEDEDRQLPGRFGVRIEDVVTVTETGGLRFNNTDHALAVVE